MARAWIFVRGVPDGFGKRVYMREPVRCVRKSRSEVALTMEDVKRKLFLKRPTGKS